MNKKHSKYLEDLECVLNIKGIEKLKGKSILVTGATGMIGVCLIDALMKYNVDHVAGVKLYAVGRDKKRASLRLGEYYDNNCFTFVEQDVRQPFPEDMDVDYVIPLASYTHPMAYSWYPVETIEINVHGAENALELAAHCGATVLYPSSVEVYGNGSVPFTEDNNGKLNLSTARSCYTESKRVAEALCQSYSAEKGVDCRIVRLSRIFGPTMLESDSKASSQFIKNAIGKEDIVLKSKGEQYFSYTYVADAVQAMLFVMLNGDSRQTYNIAAPACNVKLADFARICAGVSGTNVIFDIPSETESQGYSIATMAILDTTRINSLGWKSYRTIEDAISRTIEIISA